MNTRTLFILLITMLALAGCTKKGPSPNLCASVCNGLVAYYPFYGDATDKSGNGLDGKVIGASDARGGYPKENKQTPESMAATIYEALGIDRHATWLDELDRPHPVCHADPIEGLLA